MFLEAIVQLQDVTKRIGRKTIIDRLSLELPAGEVFGFLGPNGSGKTTTIRMMVGLMSLTAGEIKIGGYSITKQYRKAIRNVGAIVENPEMYKYLSGYQNLIHFARMIPGIKKDRIDDVIKLVGLEARIHDKVRTYSLGMRQRLGVAQAILHKPKLLLLDEPTNGLDPAGIRELRDYLRQLAREEGIAVFVSSHLLSEMELMCDRVAIIQNGKLIDVWNIQEGGERNGTASVLFEVDKIDEAMAIAGSLGMSVKREDGADEGKIKIEGDRESIAKLNEALVRGGVRVYGILAQSKSLEDQFLEMTGGEKIV
ncbi:ABC transporter ATP-binding protein [Paenibacillus sp. NEAU-GSW1]|uniref:ABC transporter ATP-binding protein n=1 Tax=Paenibacillus sp. NEAU-GSW1 TaxID=2682486 RepID=UPI0012E26188|nr:ABC transporter ATP-binding protein [Paenibacillus sp. NEAU-GSW1]MUT67647.1 ATP-binding cassette domain-containing protein [Paenibacillus sp. NEAU-GSW1]